MAIDNTLVLNCHEPVGKQCDGYQHPCKCHQYKTPCQTCKRYDKELQTIKEKIMSNQSSNSNGIGFTGLLTIVFITLKLTQVIKWSWWWVLSPVWISFAVAGVLLLVAGIAYAISRAIK